MPVKILVTGFEPFGPDAVNAAWEAVSRLPEAIGGAEIVKRRLPVEYEAGPARLEALVEELAPDAVLSVGQAAGRAALTPELVGINWKDASLPDNAGVLCQGEPIDPAGGPGPAESQRRGVYLQCDPLPPGGAGQGAGHPRGLPPRALLL